MAEQFDPTEHPHRRYNPLINEWVLVSPHRAKRPWQGQVETLDEEVKPEYDENCYLCSGNTRINGEVNDKCEKTFVYTRTIVTSKPSVFHWMIFGLTKSICGLIMWRAH